MQATGLKELTKSHDHLTLKQRELLCQVLKRHDNSFQGASGKWKLGTCDIELKHNAEPCHSHGFPVPETHKETSKKEVECPCELGVLKQIDHSEWVAPKFITPKKDGTVCFISDFCELNERIQRKPCPIPKVQDMSMKLEGFK